jgi:hypothetical protein
MHGRSVENIGKKCSAQNRNMGHLRNMGKKTVRTIVSSMAFIGQLGVKVMLEREVNMNRGLLILAAALTLTGAAQAGEIKLHIWPTVLVPQDFMTIPVTMDIGYWIRVKSQTKYVIKLSQVDVHTYDGCVTIPVETNFAATLSCSIAKVTTTGDVSGTFSCSISPSNITPGATNVQVCAHLVDANLATIPGGAKDVQVATVTVKVVPTV